MIKVKKIPEVVQAIMDVTGKTQDQVEGYLLEKLKTISKVKLNKIFKRPGSPTQVAIDLRAAEKKK